MEIKIEEYLPLIKKVAKGYRNKGVELEDLIQEGFIGLIEAKRRYKEEFNVSFSKYSLYWIKKQMVEAIIRNSKQKVHLDSRVFRIVEENKEDEFLDDRTIYLENLPEIERLILEKLFIEEKTLKEVAKELNITREKVRQIKLKAIMRIKNFNRKLTKSLN
jgi:RNA polymerase nonessential primary-like sigma factor